MHRLLTYLSLLRRSFVYPFLFFLALLCAGVVAAWTGPCGASPNDCNAAGPLDQTGTAQFKLGGLTVATGAVTTGFVVLNGNVGIGTASPDAKLKVSAPAATTTITPQFMVEGVGSGFTSLGIFSNRAGGRVWQLVSSINAAGDLGLFDSTAGLFRTYWDTAGNVGIGTVSPGNYKLNVSGNENVSGALIQGGTEGSAVSRALVVNAGGGTSLFQIAGNGSVLLGGGGQNPTYNLQVNAPNSATTYFGVDSTKAYFSGDVGIGTVSPGGKLDVVGSTNNYGLMMHGGLAYLQPSSSGANQGVHLDLANLGVGSNGIFFTLPAGWSGNFISGNDSSGVQKFGINANGTLYGVDLCTYAGKCLSTTGAGSGTVTSVAAASTVSGLALSITGTATVNPTVNLAGTLGVANGGTGATTLSGVLIGNGASAFTAKTNPTGAFVGTTDTQTLTNKTISGSSNTLSSITLSSLAQSAATTNQVATWNGSAWVAQTPAGGGGGTVTSVWGSGGTTGLTLSGGPITTFGTLTLGGTLAVANGGTGATTANAAINALLPTQASQSGKYLTTNGSNTSWATPGGSSQWTTSGSDISYSAGNVGIGTAAGGANLKVKGNSVGYALLGNDSSCGGTYSVLTLGGAVDSLCTSYTLRGGPNNDTYLNALPNTNLHFLVNNVDRMFINYAGNVGIGTSDPAQKLSVAGTIESTIGGFKFPDGTTQTTASAAGIGTIVVSTELDNYNTNQTIGYYKYCAIIAYGLNGNANGYFRLYPSFYPTSSGSYTGLTQWEIAGFSARARYVCIQ